MLGKCRYYYKQGSYWHLNVETSILKKVKEISLLAGFFRVFGMPICLWNLQEHSTGCSLAQTDLARKPLCLWAPYRVIFWTLSEKHCSYPFIFVFTSISLK